MPFAVVFHAPRSPAAQSPSPAVAPQCPRFGDGRGSGGVSKAASFDAYRAQQLAKLR